MSREANQEAIVYAALLSILILEQRYHSEKWAVPPGPKQWYR